MTDPWQQQREKLVGQRKDLDKRLQDCAQRIWLIYRENNSLNSEHWIKAIYDILHSLNVELIDKATNFEEKLKQLRKEHREQVKLLEGAVNELQKVRTALLSEVAALKAELDEYDLHLKAEATAAEAAGDTGMGDK